MVDPYSGIKKYALTLGLTPGFLWLIGGILGVYFARGNAALLLSALVTGGLPAICALFASKFNIIGSLLLILDAISIILITYSGGTQLVVILLLFISYSLPIFLSGIFFIRYWFKCKIHI